MSATESYPVVSVPTVSEEEAHRLPKDIYASEAWGDIEEIAMPFYQLERVDVRLDETPMSQHSTRCCGSTASGRRRSTAT